MPFEIRRAEITDSEAIWALNTEAFGYTYPLDKTTMRLAQSLDRGDCVLVACVEGVVRGYIHASEYTTIYDDPLINILALAIDKDARRQGLGKGLLMTVEAWAQKLGCRGVRLVSGIDRTGAHAFYCHCGYAMRKDQKHFHKRF